MTRKKGSKNHATVVREYLHKKFKDIAENDLDAIMSSVIKKAVEDESLMAQKLILDNVDKIVQWEQKNEEMAEGLKVIINRGGVSIEMGGGNMGSHTAHEVSVNRANREIYADYVGPLQVKDKLQYLKSFETKTLHKWKGEIMNLPQICRKEGVDYHKVYNLMEKHDVPLEEAIEEILEVTVIDEHPTTQ